MTSTQAKPSPTVSTQAIDNTAASNLIHKIAIQQQQTQQAQKTPVQKTDTSGGQQVSKIIMSIYYSTTYKPGLLEIVKYQPVTNYFYLLDILVS